MNAANTYGASKVRMRYKHKKLIPFTLNQLRTPLFSPSEEEFAQAEIIHFALALTLVSTIVGGIVPELQVFLLYKIVMLAYKQGLSVYVGSKIVLHTQVEVDPT
eukprot:scaffold9694_cov95-Skeletonema_dohrnii-CCMP3373.AAC.2